MMDGNPYKPSETNEVRPVIYDFYSIFSGLSLFLIIIAITLRGLNIIAINQPLLSIHYEWIYILFVIFSYTIGYMIGKR